MNTVRRERGCRDRQQHGLGLFGHTKESLFSLPDGQSFFRQPAAGPINQESPQFEQNRRTTGSVRIETATGMGGVLRR